MTTSLSKAGCYVLKGWLLDGTWGDSVGPSACKNVVAGILVKGIRMPGGRDGDMRRRLERERGNREKAGCRQVWWPSLSSCSCSWSR